MKFDPDWPFKNGYLYSIQQRGPFQIGKDFDAPGPARRILPEIKISSDGITKLESCLGRAKSDKVASHHRKKSSEDDLFKDVMSEHALKRDVTEALRWFVSDCLFQADEIEIRGQIKSLQRALKHFKSCLPIEHDALGKFIHDTFTGEAFLRNDLKPPKNLADFLQDKWRDDFGFAAIVAKLNVMLNYIHACEQALGRTKPRNHRVQTLVRSLAKIWHQQTGAWPKSGRTEKNEQTGLFADFVRITNRCLPNEFRVVALNPAIRDACKRPKGFS